MTGEIEETQGGDMLSAPAQNTDTAGNDEQSGNISSAASSVSAAGEENIPGDENIPNEENAAKSAGEGIISGEKNAGNFAGEGIIPSEGNGINSDCRENAKTAAESDEKIKNGSGSGEDFNSDSNSELNSDLSSAEGLRKKRRAAAGRTAMDVLTAVVAGMIVAVAYFFFQNDNGFAPGGVGGLATMTYYLTGYRVPWAYLMLAFNLPIFILVTIFVNRKLGLYLILYMLTQSGGAELLRLVGAKSYCLANNGSDFEIVFACIATGVVSGLGFSIMLRRFGASGGTYAISALIKKARPATNVAYVAFLMDSSVVFIAFFVYGMKITPVLCTLINLFIANVVVDYFLQGLRNGFKFEIVTDEPERLAEEILTRLKHGVTEMRVVGMYSHTEKHLVMCIVRKKEIGEMMKIIKKYPGSFASFEKVNEVFGRFHK